VLHTSGSSGDPKGVACTHSSILNIVTHFQREYPLCEDDRCCLTSNLTFDVSVYEMLSALLYGLTLYVPDRYTVFSPEDLFRYIYAVLHSPTYRKRYAEFLKRDYPLVSDIWESSVLDIVGEGGLIWQVAPLTEDGENHFEDAEGVEDLSDLVGGQSGDEPVPGSDDEVT
jgi:hypothetical protein